MNNLPRPLTGVLFDLDGTLLDSAHGLYAALKAYTDEHHLTPPGYERVRETVSRGSMAILRTVWSQADEQELATHQNRFLDLYGRFSKTMSPPFDGVNALLDDIEKAGIPWGIVTNKPAFLAKPLLKEIGWWPRIAAFVAGDTLDVSKPHPEPVLDACRQAGIDPASTLFVGDDRRDMAAGNAAGAYTIAAAWGYLNAEDPQTWQANQVFASVHQLTHALQGVFAP